MKLNEDAASKGTAAPVAGGDRRDSLYEFIQRLQSCPEIQSLWMLLLKEIGKQRAVKKAELVYQAGASSGSLEFEEGGITSSPISPFPFPGFRKDFDHKITNEEIVIFKRIDGYCTQIRIETDDPEFIAKEFAELVHLFFNQLFLLLKIKDLEYYSVKDDITMAYNQNYLKAFIQSEIERSRRYAAVFSLIFFDMDNLKTLNERYGHLVGTEVLKEVASVLRTQVRKMDLLSRFGGDEFVIVLLHADAEKTRKVCLRIKKALKKHVFLKDKGLNINVAGCFGISNFPEHGDTVDDLIRKSDLAMYEVKRKGKNGINIYKGDK